MNIRIKPQFIGGVLNLPNLADQSVAKLKSLHCWHLYASGKASIGRKSSVEAIRRILLKHGYPALDASGFLTAVVERVRMEQQAEETLVGQFGKCAVCGGDLKMVATNDSAHPLQAICGTIHRQIGKE